MFQAIAHLSVIELVLLGLPLVGTLIFIGGMAVERILTGPAALVLPHSMAKRQPVIPTPAAVPSAPAGNDAVHKLAA